MIPVFGLPKFPAELDYQYSFTEELAQDVAVSPFQSGITSRFLVTSHTKKTFDMRFKVVQESTMKILEKFYIDVGGPLKPFLFEPPIEKFNRYTQLVTNGTQQLQDFTDGSLRAGKQSYVVRFTEPFSRTLFKPLLESTGLVLEQVMGEENRGKYVHFDGLLQSQNAMIADHDQDYLDMGTKGFMFGFLFRGETVFLSTSASYASLNTKTLIFAIAGTSYTVTFTATATDASTVVEAINDQHGAVVEAQVFGTTEIKIRTVDGSGYFTISGTAFAGLDLAAPVIYPIHKHDGVDTGYYFKQDGTGDLTFFLEDGTTAKTITASTTFHLLDGAWHFVAVACDRSGNGQIYVDADVSGAAMDISSANLSLDNTADFYLHKDANADIDMDRIESRSWDSGDMPSTISALIGTLYSDWFRIDDDSGLNVLYTFDNSGGEDTAKSEDLTLNNDPTFIDF